MNRAFFRIVAVCLAGLHLADATLISGGRWLAAHVHSHPLACAAQAETKPSACSHKHGCCAKKHKPAHTEAAHSGSGWKGQSPRHDHGPCDSCAACRHESQSLLGVQWVQFQAVQSLVEVQSPVSPRAAVSRSVRHFDSRGPPAVV